MTTETLGESVRNFLTAYTQAFDARDGNQIAALYHAPCVTVRGDGSIHCLQSRGEVQAFFQQVADTYYREGYRSSRFQDLEVVAIGARSALASLERDLLPGDGTVLRRWNQSYNLVRVGDGWKILVSTFHLS
jgi:ketosteroid isomerase-like protein